jgi:hypothetical protein
MIFDVYVCHAPGRPENLDGPPEVLLEEVVPVLKELDPLSKMMTRVANFRVHELLPAPAPYESALVVSSFPPNSSPFKLELANLIGPERVAKCVFWLRRTYGDFWLETRVETADGRKMKKDLHLVVDDKGANFNTIVELVKARYLEDYGIKVAKFAFRKIVLT